MARTRGVCQRREKVARLHYAERHKACGPVGQVSADTRHPLATRANARKTHDAAGRRSAARRGIAGWAGAAARHAARGAVSESAPQSADSWRSVTADGLPKRY